VKRVYTFVQKTGSVEGRTPSGEKMEIPLFPGILKHLNVVDLPRYLGDPAVLLKYTREALRTAPWQVLREFPPAWLKQCLTSTEMRPGRRRALEFLLE